MRNSETSTTCQRNRAVLFDSILLGKRKQNFIRTFIKEEYPSVKAVEIAHDPANRNDLSIMISTKDKLDKAELENKLAEKLGDEYTVEILVTTDYLLETPKTE